MSNISRSRRKNGWTLGAAFSWIGFDKNSRESKSRLVDVVVKEVHGQKILVKVYSEGTKRRG